MNRAPMLSEQELKEAVDGFNANDRLAKCMQRFQQKSIKPWASYYSKDSYARWERYLKRFENCLEPKEQRKKEDPCCDDPTSKQQIVDFLTASRRDAIEWEKLADDPPDPDYRQIAAARADTVADHLQAVTTSLERYQGAQQHGDIEAMTRQFTALSLYLKRVAAVERRAADERENFLMKLPVDVLTAEELRAVEARWMERLRKSGGLTAKEIDQFGKFGVSADQARAFAGRILARTEPSPVKSLPELLKEDSAFRRQMATELEEIAAAPPGGADGSETAGSGQPHRLVYSVGNPRDREAAVDLFIRPMAMPPGWKLSVVDSPAVSADPTPRPTEQPKKQVQEVIPGKHYRVVLPAKGEIQVASMAVPVGELGMNTTARWAVEGKIGNDVIGGIVHELHAPGIVPDLQLPPIGATDTSAIPEGGVGRSWWSRSAVYVVVAGALLLAAGAILIVFWRRARKV